MTIVVVVVVVAVMWWVSSRDHCAAIACGDVHRLR